MGEHQRFLLATQLRHVEHLTEEIARLDAAIDKRLRPFGDAVRRLDTIPGVGKRGAEEILAWLGTDIAGVGGATSSTGAIGTRPRTSCCSGSGTLAREEGAMIASPTRGILRVAPSP
jgi:hypothetical protein